ncbi:Ankyrin repeat-containing protein At5g02620 [Linum perenne]
MARIEDEDTRRKLRREKAHLQIEVLSGGKADSIKALVNKIPKPLLEEKDENGNTALHNAAAAGNKAAVEILMESNWSLLMERNSDEDSPLHVASVFGHRETVSFLLSKTSRPTPTLHFSSSSSIQTREQWRLP